MTAHKVIHKSLGVSAHYRIPTDICIKAWAVKLPILALKERQKKRQEFFINRAYDQTGLDN
jgi:hypothetical protein